jgi:rhodanese-related sulfurtransferase
VRWLVARFPHVARAACLVVVGLVVGATYNAANPMGIRWVPSPDGRVGLPRAFESRLPEINAARALSLLTAEEALFVDSRDEEDYGKGHVPGAINVPMRRWNEVWPEMEPQVPRDRTLVLYCYGAHCGLSTRQAKRLLELGYDRLLVLYHGWKAWTEAGYPTQREPKAGGG